MRALALVLAFVSTIFVALPSAVQAQVANSVVVSSCGSKSYTTGQPAPDTQTAGGNKCTSGTASVTFPTTSGTPCATATTAGCSIPDIDALIAQTAGNPILVGPSASPTALIQATASVPITFTAAGGPTQIIGASGSTKIYITHWDVVLSGAGTFVLVTGTGTNCGTNTAYLNGASGHPLSFAANGGISAGSGLGAVLITGAGGEVCAITTGSVDSSGSIAYAQF